MQMFVYVMLGVTLMNTWSLRTWLGFSMLFEYMFSLCACVVVLWHNLECYINVGMFMALMEFSRVYNSLKNSVFLTFQKLERNICFILGSILFRIMNIHVHDSKHLFMTCNFLNKVGLTCMCATYRSFS